MAYGIGLWEDGLAVLEELDRLNTVQEYAISPSGFEVRSSEEGLLTRAALPSAKTLLLAIYRGDPHAALWDAVPDDWIRMDTSPEQIIKKSDGVDVTFDDKTTERSASSSVRVSSAYRLSSSVSRHDRNSSQKPSGGCFHRSSANSVSSSSVTVPRSASWVRPENPDADISWKTVPSSLQNGCTCRVTLLILVKHTTVCVVPETHTPTYRVGRVIKRASTRAQAVVLSQRQTSFDGLESFLLNSGQIIQDMCDFIYMSDISDYMHYAGRVDSESQVQTAACTQSRRQGCRC